MIDRYRHALSLFVLMLCSSLFPSLLSAQPFTPGEPMKISIEPYQDTNLIQQWPGIFVRNNNVLVTWGEMRPKRGNDNGGLTFTLLFWPNSREFPTAILDTIHPDTVKPDLSVPSFVFGFGHVEQPQSLDGGVMVASSHWRDDMMTAAPNDIFHRGIFSLYIAQQDGWGRLRLFDSTKRTDQVAVAMKGHSYNPDAGEFVSAWSVGSSATGTITAVDTSSVVKWSIPNVPLPGRAVDLMPIGVRDFIAIFDTVGVRYSNGSLLSTFELPDVDGARYLRLRDTSFLRVYTDTGLTKFTVDHYSATGSLLGSQDVLAGRANPSFFMTQDRTHGDIALLVGGPDGVYVMLFDEKLVANAPIRLNTSTDTTNAPAAAFRGDTLCSVWQEYHNGMIDIYGTELRVRVTEVEPVSVESEEAIARGLAITSIAPNPARNVAIINLASTPGLSVRIDLVDPLGRVVRTQWRDKSAAGQTELRLDGIAPGAYMVVAHAGTHTATAKLVVMH